MPEQHTATFDVAPFTRQTVDLNSVSLIERLRKRVEGWTRDLADMRVELAGVHNGFTNYTSQVAALQRLTAIIHATASVSVDKDDEAALRRYGTYAKLAEQAHSKVNGYFGSLESLAFPESKVCPELVEEYRGLAHDAVEHMTAFDEWSWLDPLPPSEQAQLDVQMALEDLNGALAGLMGELLFSPYGDDIDSLLHDDWFDGEVKTLTRAACNSLFDIALLYTRRSTFRDVDALLWRSLHVKAATHLATCIDQDVTPSDALIRRIGSSGLKSLKWTTSTLPSGALATGFEVWKASWESAGKTKDYDILRERYNKDITAARGNVGAIGSVLDVFILLLAVQNARITGNWYDYLKIPPDAVDATTSAALTFSRIYTGAALAKTIDTYKNGLGKIGPICKIISNVFSLIGEAQKENPNKVVMGTALLQIVGASFQLYARVVMSASTEMAAASAARYASYVVLGEACAGLANVALVVDAAWALNAQIDSHYRKNAVVVGVLVAMLEGLVSAKAPHNDHKFHEFFGITEKLTAMQSMMPTLNAGMFSDAWEGLTNIIYGEEQVYFFGLPPIFGLRNVEPGELNYANFEVKVGKEMTNAALRGNGDGSRSTPDDYARCKLMLTSLGIRPEDAVQMFYWTPAQLKMIDDDWMTRWSFWVAKAI